jgi:hypothetical protein
LPDSLRPFLLPVYPLFSHHFYLAKYNRSTLPKNLISSKKPNLWASSYQFSYLFII